MAIKWFNIRSGESVVAESEPHIAALWSSSDHSPNITQGQDFGWRLAPEVVVEMKRIKQDLGQLEHIAQRFRKLVEEVNETDILTWISNKTALEQAPVAQVSDYQDEYDAEIKRLEGKPVGGTSSVPAIEEEVTTTTTEPEPTTTTTTEQETTTSTNEQVQ